MRLLCLIALSGCSLYFGKPDEDAVPDATTNVDAGDPDVIARPCIRAAVGGNFLGGGADEVFLTYVCDAPGAGGIIEFLTYSNGRLVAGMPMADFQQPFVHAKQIPPSSPHATSVLAIQPPQKPGGWLFASNSGLRYDSMRPFTDVTVGDLDGGSRDLVFAGDGAIRAKLAFDLVNEIEVLGGRPFTHVAVGDFGGSAANDLFFVATVPGQPVEIGFATQTSAAPLTFDISRAEEPPGTPIPLAVADLDGDSKPDVIGGAARLFIYTSTTGSFWTLAEAPAAVATGNFVGDAKPEAIFLTADRTQVRRVEIASDGTLSSKPLLAAGGDAMTVADLDGDMRSDLLLVHDTGKTSSTLTMHLTR